MLLSFFYEISIHLMYEIIINSESTVVNKKKGKHAKLKAIVSKED